MNFSFLPVRRFPHSWQQGKTGHGCNCGSQPGAGAWAGAAQTQVFPGVRCPGAPPPALRSPTSGCLQLSPVPGRPLPRGSHVPAQSCAVRAEKAATLVLGFALLQRVAAAARAGKRRQRDLLVPRTQRGMAVTASWDAWPAHGDPELSPPRGAHMQRPRPAGVRLPRPHGPR